MNTDTIQGDWKRIKGKVKEKWGRLSNDDVDVINGRRDQLVGRIQKAYGKTRDEVEREVATFEKSCGCGAGRCG